MRPCPTGAPPSASCARESKRAAACHLAEPKEPRMRGLRMGKSGARRKRRVRAWRGPVRSPFCLPLATPPFLPACSTCRALARRTGNGASKARFAGERHAKPVAVLRYERNRARVLRDERDLTVRRDIPLRFERRTPHAGVTSAIPCAGPAKRAGDCTGPAKRAGARKGASEMVRTPPCLSGSFIPFDNLCALCITSVTWG